MDFLIFISSMLSTIMTFKLLYFLNKINIYSEIKQEYNEDNQETNEIKQDNDEINQKNNKIKNNEISNEILYVIITHLKSIKKLLEIYNKLNSDNIIELFNLNNILEELHSNIVDYLPDTESNSDSVSDIDTDTDTDTDSISNTKSDIDEQLDSEIEQIEVD